MTKETQIMYPYDFKGISIRTGLNTRRVAEALGISYTTIWRAGAKGTGPRWLCMAAWGLERMMADQRAASAVMACTATGDKGGL